jgi:hypothetical protein
VEEGEEERTEGRVPLDRLKEEGLEDGGHEEGEGVGGKPAL